MTLRRKLAAGILRKLNRLALHYLEKHGDKLQPAQVLAAYHAMMRVERAACELDGTRDGDYVVVRGRDLN